MNGVVNFVRGAYYEFTNHVTWPKWSVAQSSTVAVAVATLILAIFLYFVDMGFSELINMIYRVLKG
ncbi:MAG: preprotein translocase subunit SecE [Weeksellaceae bacterium]|nr:preprotein translocase subunit SecE [Weeksellaceae bacterium]